MGLQEIETIIQQCLLLVRLLESSVNEFGDMSEGEGTWLRGCRYLVSGTWYISGDNALDVRSGHTCQVCSARAHSPLQPNLFPLPRRMLEDSTWFLVFWGGNDVCFQFMPFYSNCSVVLHQLVHLSHFDYIEN